MSQSQQVMRGTQVRKRPGKTTKQRALHVAKRRAPQLDVDSFSSDGSDEGDDTQRPPEEAPPAESNTYYDIELEASRGRQYGAAASVGRSKRLSEIFNYDEDKPDRRLEVFDIINQAFQESVGKIGMGAAALQDLDLETRGDKQLTKTDVERVCDVVMAAVDDRMREKGFEGLERPLVRLEALHARRLIRSELWCPGWRAPGKKAVDPRKDGVYYLIYRRNTSVVEREGKMLVYEYAKKFGLKDVYIRPATLEFLETTQRLRSRTKSGVLDLTEDELHDLETDKEQQERILTKISEQKLSSLTVENAVPWLRSPDAVAILAARLMGVRSWRKLLPAMKKELKFYGECVQRNGKDAELQKYGSIVSEAKKEHESDLHVMIRVLSAALKVDPGYFIIAGVPDLREEGIREVANGGKFPCCIVASKRTGETDTEYSVHVEGQAVAYFSKLSRAYCHLTLLQTVLFLDGSAGSKSMDKLVEALNLLCYGVKYEKSELNRKYHHLMAAIDRCNREESTRSSMEEADEEV